MRGWFLYKDLQTVCAEQSNLDLSYLVNTQTMAALYVALVLFYGWACFSANAEDSNNTCPTYYESCLDAYYKLKCKGGAKSGEYIITKPTVQKVYCEMDSTKCGEGGWMRVAELDMTFHGAECPSRLDQGLYGGKKLCGRQRAGCSSVRFNNFGVPYSRVCGYVAAYQDKTPDGFHGKNQKIDSTYLDGISITYGSPRKHIWSLAAGASSGRSKDYNCPCNTGAPDNVPYFVGRDYYCESGNPTTASAGKFFPDDVLWDGKKCTLREVPCCKHPWMPSFHKELGEFTTDTIELRLCHDQPGSDEDVPIESYQFFVR